MRSAPSHRTSPGFVILLVDDNRDGIIARRSVLEELGYTVVSANSGLEALQAFEDHAFDLVVTDYKMAPIGGIELIQNLRSRNFRGPVILLTGFADTLGLSSETTGADVVIQKSANEISALVRNAKRLLNPPKKPARSQGGSSGRGQSAGS